MHCSQCGAQMGGGARFCAGCGASIGGAVAVSAPAQANPRGSGGNVLAAIASFFCPGLGQLAQGRILAGIFVFICASILWVFLMGWLMHLIAAIDAARWRPARA